jgi:hypothetical protein
LRWILPPEVLVFKSGPPAFKVPFSEERFNSDVVSGSLVETPPPKVEASIARFASRLMATVILPPEVLR